MSKLLFCSLTHGELNSKKKIGLFATFEKHVKMSVKNFIITFVFTIKTTKTTVEYYINDFKVLGVLLVSHRESFVKDVVTSFDIL